MIRDARLDSEPVNYSTQLAIVGAGPAGLTLARELGGGTDVLVIEGGGFENDAEQEALLTGECAGLAYPLTETRARRFGGSSALWAGYCAQFDEHDFLFRDWVPGSGWPFGVEAIEPYYSRVAELLGLGGEGLRRPGGCETIRDCAALPRRQVRADRLALRDAYPTVW